MSDIRRIRDEAWAMSLLEKSIVELLGEHAKNDKGDFNVSESNLLNLTTDYHRWRGIYYQ